MIGKNLYEIVTIVKQYQEGKSKEEICDELQNYVQKELGKTGLNNLDEITDSGMIALLFYLYGAGIVDEELIMTFATDSSRQDISFYKVSFVPADGEHIFKLDIRYMRKVEGFTKDAMDKD